MRTGVLVALAVAMLPSKALADSDGYFCVGRGYLAYERRFAAAPARHQLQVVRFGGTRGIVADAPVLLDDFQVHGMRCTSQRVEIVGWHTTYLVDVSGSASPVAVEQRGVSNGTTPTSPPANLGHWAQPSVLSLEAEGDDLFQLVIARTSQRVSGGVEHHTVTRLIQRRVHGPPGQEIAGSLQVFEGVFRESID